MFWEFYYVKGAFLDSDKAFEVLSACGPWNYGC